MNGFGFAPDVTLALQANLAVMQKLHEQIGILERRLVERVKLDPDYALLNTVPGIGPVLATTIMLETGTSSRFAKVGNFSSDCRCVDSRCESNSRKKGEGNTKNGNRYFAWALVEAANVAIRSCPEPRRFYERKERNCRD
ncbi:transposase [Trinickia mobilis]|uniref:transposase n=1 Tax=Trinickia mobilis TaxID=2816356 RepID=UPI002867F7B2|nr:transposase [Trinickia mobilis]